MAGDTPNRNDGRERIVGWSALAGSALAVLAWAACCVLPMALSLAGLSLAGAAFLAGQRALLTWAAVAMVGVGWWSVWRRRRACARDGRCAPPSRLMIGLLAVATALVGLALTWQPVVEPAALTFIRSLRG